MNPPSWFTEVDFQVLGYGKDQILRWAQAASHLVLGIVLIVIGGLLLYLIFNRHRRLDSLTVFLSAVCWLLMGALQIVDGFLFFSPTYTFEVLLLGLRVFAVSMSIPYLKRIYELVVENLSQPSGSVDILSTHTIHEAELPYKDHKKVSAP